MNAHVELQEAFFRFDTAHRIDFRGVQISSEALKKTDLSHKRVAIIGTDQFTVSYLNTLSQTATQLYIFQIQPRLILPHTPKITSTLIPHPLIARNRRLFSNCVKRVLALRFLEREVPNIWLRRLLTANAAHNEKQFLKSDSYFQALQRENCQLITWPIAQIHGDYIETINAEKFKIDVIVYAN